MTISLASAEPREKAGLSGRNLYAEARLSFPSLTVKRREVLLVPYVDRLFCPEGREK